MSLLKKIIHYAGFGKKDDMAKSEEFKPTDIIKHRYQDPQVLIDFVKSLPDGFTDGQITVKVLKENRLGLRLPRELEAEEIEAVHKAFIKAERKRKMDDDD